MFFELRETAGPGAGGGAGWGRYDGDVLTLEEDHRPTPDLLLTLRRLLDIKNAGAPACPACYGVYLKFGCAEQARAPPPRAPPERAERTRTH